MKKKVLSTLLALTMAGTMLAGCGGNSGASDSGDGAAETSADTGDEAEDTADAPEAADDVEPTAQDTVGPEDGTKLNLWTFADVHAGFYKNMVELWNKENPDKQLCVTVTAYPYQEMHTKLTMALQTGEGAPDISDIERAKFPNYLQGEPQLVPLNEWIAPIEDQLIESRLTIYGKDGNYYGAPFHVGAEVMYYNDEILSANGIDYTTIKTWDDFTEAAKTLKEATGGKVKMTSVDTTGVDDWMWSTMAAYEEDQVKEDGTAYITDHVQEMLSMQQEWLKDELVDISPDGDLDREVSFQYISDGNIAAFPKALWYMSRFTQYMPDQKGKWAIAPMPTFEEGQPRSVGMGGTGTAVTKQSKNPELAAEFIVWCKLSEEGSAQIWDQLGFDAVNTAFWTDPEITQNPDNQYLQFFKTNPFDVLGEIKDEVQGISINSNTVALADYVNTTMLNNILKDNMPVDEAVQDAMDAVAADNIPLK